TTTSFIAACGSGRSTNFAPAVPAARFVTTIAFIGHLPVSSSCLQGSQSVDVLHPRQAARAVRRSRPDRLQVLGTDSCSVERRKRTLPLSGALQEQAHGAVVRISLARWRVPSLPRSTRPRRRRAVEGPVSPRTGSDWRIEDTWQASAGFR